MSNKWIQFVKDYAAKNNLSYSCAMTKPEAKDAYRAANPKLSKSTKRRTKLKEVVEEALEKSNKKKNVIVKQREEKKEKSEKEPKVSIDGNKYYLQNAKIGDKEYFITKDKDPYGNKLIIKKDGTPFGVYNISNEEYLTSEELQEAIEQFGEKATKWYIEYGFIDSTDDIEGGKVGPSLQDRYDEVSNRYDALMAGPDAAWQGQYETLTKLMSEMEDALNEVDDADDDKAVKYHTERFTQDYNDAMDILDRITPVEGGMLSYPTNLYTENYRIDDLEEANNDKMKQLNRLKYKEFLKNREIESILKGEYKDHELANEMIDTLTREQEININRTDKKLQEIENIESRTNKAKKMVMDLDKSKTLKGFTDSKGNTIYGESVGNWISSVVKGRQDYPPKMREIINKYGDKRILRMFACRTPLGSLLTSALNAVSLGEFNKRWESQPYDKLFHLDIRIDVLEDPKSRKITTILLEKNEVLNAIINPQKSKETECILISVFPRPMTIRKMLAGAQQIQGDKFFKYSAYNNNCQDFIMALLKGIGAGTQENYDFIKQDTKELFKGLPGTRKFANTVTDIGATFNTLIEGAGPRERLTEALKHAKEFKDEFRDEMNKQENQRFISKRLLRANEDKASLRDTVFKYGPNSKKGIQERKEYELKRMSEEDIRGTGPFLSRNRRVEPEPAPAPTNEERRLRYIRQHLLLHPERIREQRESLLDMANLVGQAYLETDEQINDFYRTGTIADEDTEIEDLIDLRNRYRTELARIQPFFDMFSANPTPMTTPIASREPSLSSIELSPESSVSSGPIAFYNEGLRMPSILTDSTEQSGRGFRRFRKLK